MMKKNIMLAILIAFSCFAAQGHHMVCIDLSRVPTLEPQGLKCLYNYIYDTSDNQGYRCYINFFAGYGVSIVAADTLEPNDLGTIAIKADIFGVPSKHKEVHVKKEVQSMSAKGKTVEKPTTPEKPKEATLPLTINNFTACQYGTPLAIKFKPFIMNAAGVNRLFKRNRRGENLPLLDSSGKGNDLQSLIGPGIKVENVEDLIYTLNKAKILHCSSDLSK